MAMQIFKNKARTGIVAMGSRPVTGITELTQHHQSIGNIATPRQALAGGTDFFIFARITRHLIDDVQRRDADAQQAAANGHFPWG